MCPDRMWNDNSWSNDQLRARTDVDCGSGPSSGCTYARRDVVSAIVASNARLMACLGIYAFLASACELPIRPRLETRTKESDMCVS